MLYNVGVTRISVRPDVCHGKPCVSGTRVQVVDVLDLAAAGKSFREIMHATWWKTKTSTWSKRFEFTPMVFSRPDDLCPDIRQAHRPPALLWCELQPRPGRVHLPRL